MEAFLNIIVELAPLWWVILAVLIGFGMRYHYSTRSRLEKLEGKTDSVSCDLHEHRISTQEKSTDKIFERLDYIIDTFIKQRPPTLQSNSPLSLSPLGIAIEKELELDKMVCNNWEKILTHLDSNSIASKNPYDIQQFCMEEAHISLEKFLAGVDIEKIKNHAYYKGNPLTHYSSIIGILIRDKYFRSKNIDVTEVDQHIPATPGTA